ncbi:MAG: phosphatidate cytidylyltransferase, partial [Acidimicrobiales bacterium]
TESQGGEQFFGFDDDGDAFRDFDERVPDFDPPILPPEASATDDPAPEVSIGAGAAAGAAAAGPSAAASRPARQPDEPAPSNGGSDRNLPMALGTAGILIAVAAVAFAVGSWAVMLLVTVLLGLAAAEFFNAIRPAGYQPPVLLGVAAITGLSLAVYWRGEVAIPMVLVLLVVFGALWYLLQISSENPVGNLGITFLGVIWIGVLGSFGALMLRSPDGRALLFGAIAVTVAYDVGAWAVGRVAGKQPLSTASPNKTMEGLIGGCGLAVAVGIVLGAAVGPWSDQLVNGLLLGIAAAVMAPLGDLTESLVKRDLGLKDMGQFLPGHGGLLDRFDAMLFVLPTAFYVALLRDLIV